MLEKNNKEEIEVIDVLMNDSEIDEAIAHLMELKEHKKSVQFPLASDLDLSVTYSDEEVEGEIEESLGETDEKVVESDSKMEELK
ncbi:MAG: hypothetical protein AABX94_01400 [Nanoarchaeota archaeon]